MERFRPKQLSKKELQEAEKLGGSDFNNWEEYEKPDSIPSYDKGGHRRRSITKNNKHLKNK